MKMFVPYVLVLLTLASMSPPAARADEVVRCYQCRGYDSRRPVSVKQNNPECPTGSFNESAIQSTPLRAQGVCFKVDYVKDGVEMTARGTTMKLETGCVEGKSGLPGIQVEGTICGCTENLCNKAGNPLIAGPLLAAMLAVARLLV